jgi:hypothetical protein
LPTLNHPFAEFRSMSQSGQPSWQSATAVLAGPAFG